MVDCKNCKHKTDDMYGDHYGAIIFEACRLAPVFSEYGDDVVQYTPCSDMRAQDGECGPGGVKFEPATCDKCEYMEYKKINMFSDKISVPVCGETKPEIRPLPFKADNTEVKATCVVPDWCPLK